MSPLQGLLLASALLCIGLYGMLTRKHAIGMLLALELILNAVAVAAVVLGRVYGDSHAQLFALFVLALAACEAAIGLAIVLLVSRSAKTVFSDELNRMRG
jgi:NADH-quinone oxidoreductase subunit K